MAPLSLKREIREILEAFTECKTTIISVLTFEKLLLAVPLGACAFFDRGLKIQFSIFSGFNLFQV